MYTQILIYLVFILKNSFFVIKNCKNIKNLCNKIGEPHFCVLSISKTLVFFFFLVIGIKQDHTCCHDMRFISKVKGLNKCRNIARELKTPSEVEQQHLPFIDILFVGGSGER